MSDVIILAIIALSIVVGLQVKKILSGIKISKLKKRDEELKDIQNKVDKEIDSLKNDILTTGTLEANKNIDDVEKFWNKK